MEITAPPFTPPPEAPEAMPPRVTGSFFGVPIPADVAVFDCRVPDEAQTPVAPWGELFFSRAAYAVGQRQYTLPRSLTASYDTRKPESATLTAAGIAYIIDAYREVERDEAVMPLAIEIENFGFLVIGAHRR